MYWSYQNIILKIYFFLQILIGTTAYADIQEIKASGKLRVGVCMQEQPPFYYKNQQGELVGIDINIIKSISYELGVQPEFVVDRKTWDEVVQDVVDHRVDLAASNISITPQRASTVSFSLSYVEIKPVMVLNRMSLIRAAQQKAFTLTEMFTNTDFSLYTPDGSSYSTLANKLFGHSKKVKIFSNTNTINLQKVLVGEALGYLTDEVEIENAVLQNPEYKLHIITYPIKEYSDQIALPISYQNPRLLSVVNSVLQTRKMYYSTEDIIQMLKNIQHKD